MTRLLLAAAVVLAGIAAVACAEGDFPEPTPSPTASPTLTSTPRPTPTPVPHITLAAVGDIMLDRGLGQLMLRDGPEAPFADVVDVLLAADVTVGNLEAAISLVGLPLTKEYTFRAPPIAVDALRLAGFDVLAQANNHSLDYGEEAMLDTLSRLREAGIESVGAGSTSERAYAPVVLNVQGIRLAFLSYTDIPSPAWKAAEESPGVAWIDAERIATDIATAKQTADTVAVFFHFGIEGSLVVTEAQREQAHAAIDAGATLVLGSHPHVLQEVEEYEGGIIAYSLGNFAFDGFDEEPQANDSAILRIELSPFGVVGWNLVPVRIVGGWPTLVER